MNMYDNECNTEFGATSMQQELSNNPYLPRINVLYFLWKNSILPAVIIVTQYYFTHFEFKSEDLETFVLRSYQISHQWKLVG